MNSNKQPEAVRHVFIIGSKSIGQYGGYETFVDKLIEQHQNESGLRYHIACKANGEGFMDESKLDGVEILKKDKNVNVTEFSYHNAHVFKVPCPNIGPAVAIYYDRTALIYSIDYCIANQISHPIFYILTCRIGLFINSLVKQIKAIGGMYYLNPDGHEWMRAKWPAPVRKYWKWSERKMVIIADVVICDSLNIKKYIEDEYHHHNTTYISYGADITPSAISDSDPTFVKWLEEKGLEPNKYYLVVGRFVPENNFETMIREFMMSKSKLKFAIVTNMNDKLRSKLEASLNFSSDSRVKFVGTVYNQQLLKKIRENAYGYLHGHEVGGTNPSLLEALGSTKLNLLLDVGFNREVGQDTALYWRKTKGDLASLIDRADVMDHKSRSNYGQKAQKRIISAYSWQTIGEEYKKVFR